MCLDDSSFLTINFSLPFYSWIPLYTNDLLTTKHCINIWHPSAEDKYGSRQEVIHLL